VKRYDDIATISWPPTFEALRGVPVRRLSRKEKAQAIERANNSRLLGFGRALVQGREVPGFYFDASRGSAEGVAWSTGMSVYHLTMDRYFAPWALPAGVKFQEAAARVARRYLRKAAHPDNAVGQA